ncbi:MAG TPA: YigZ family protein [Caldithrix abyssi]|uniref:YigZ family protein n=1 Tax=Caldithrix abyssi TaxID=187145 RepID=A0A7V5PME4_CALAY|nr:YigZ family protein [Caldithrix abyssi]
MNTASKLSVTGDEYKVPANDVMAELKVKGSRFIAQVFHVSSREEAEQVYDRVKKKYHNATHNCFAYRIDADQFRYSDDGEPSGTAGKPILQALDGHELLEALCVVTRYFGGTKLGTGGLIRAYGGAAELALEKLTVRVKVRTVRYRLQLPYEQEPLIRRLLSNLDAAIVSADYERGVTLVAAVPVSKGQNFESQLDDLKHLGIQREKIETPED